MHSNNGGQKLQIPDGSLIQPALGANNPYYSFAQYLRARFGERVWRVPLEAGFDCPNRDGVRAYGGCTFCTADGSSAQLQDPEQSLAAQLNYGIEHKRRQTGAQKFIAYLQSFTNTYGEVDYLRAVYQGALAHPQVVMLAIGTRPDCLPPSVVDLLAEFSERTELWLDLGLQTIHDQTQARINRAHTAAEYFSAVARLRERAPLVKICTHVIVGLPGEDLSMAQQTIEAVTRSEVAGIKLHNLCVLAKTKLAQEYARGEFEAIGLEEYLEFLLAVLPQLPPTLTVHRLMAEAAREDELIAPAWASDKDAFLLALRRACADRLVWQGRDLEATPPA